MADQIEQIATAELIPYARNARTHSPAQVAGIAGSIREFGFNNPVLIDKDNGIIAGHGRVMAAQQLGLETVPCLRLGHLTKTQRKAYILADNRLAELVQWDTEMLAMEIADLRLDDVDLELLGFDDDGLKDLLGEGEPEQGLTDPDATPEVPVTPISKPGDLWILGNHRLLCGDSTQAEAVALLMVGEVAVLVITDPPYGVSYADKNSYLNASDQGKRNETPIANDHLSKADAQALWKAAFTAMTAMLDKGAVVYCFMPQGGDQMMMMMMMMMEAGIEPRHELIWLKNNHVLGRTDYAYKHEPILYAWKAGGHKFYGDFQTSILEFPRPNKSDLHPTMKPVPLLAHLIANSSRRGELLYEPFSGSGSTLIAAEQTGRRCYAMEISPLYVDVAVRRWQTFTGQTATHADTGQPFPAHG